MKLYVLYVYNKYVQYVRKYAKVFIYVQTWTFIRFLYFKCMYTVCIYVSIDVHMYAYVYICMYTQVYVCMYI